MSMSTDNHGGFLEKGHMIGLESKGARWPGASVTDALSSSENCHLTVRAGAVPSQKLIICMCFMPCHFKFSSKRDATEMSIYYSCTV